MALLAVGTGQVVSVATFLRATNLIDTGRYAEVYEALDLPSSTDVALKLYKGTDPNAHAMAALEATVLARLSTLNSEYFPRLKRSAKHRLGNQFHPLLVLELGAYYRADGSREHVTLDDVIAACVGGASQPIAEEPFWSSAAVVRWVVHMFQAVKLLGDCSVIHRDIKPANILIKRPAVRSESVPMFVDFNSSPGSSATNSGTPHYLPPEVGQRLRTEPSNEDDVWACAVVAWEMLHGLGARPGDGRCLGTWVDDQLPGAAIGVLRDALLVDRERRLVQVDQIIERLEPLGRTSVPKDSADPIGASEFSEAQAIAGRLRPQLEELLAPPHLLWVPKELSEAVGSLFLWLNEDETQALDLVGEIVRLGPRAIAAVFEQGHKLSARSPAAGQVLEAVLQLAEADGVFALRAVEVFGTSSSTGTRWLCREMCDQRQVFPNTLLNALHSDLELFLPDERLQLAQMCVRYSESRKASGTAIKYMCREYLADPNRYSLLKGIVAQALSETRDRKLAAQVLVWYTGGRKWTDLPEFERTPEVRRAGLEGGLYELLADAFSVLGESALKLVTEGGLPRVPNASPKVFNRFVYKLALRYEPAKAWALEAHHRNPADWELERIVGKLTSQPSPNVDSLEVEQNFKQFLQDDDRNAFNALRFSHSRVVFDVVRRFLTSGPNPAQVASVLRLLNGFENRERPLVVACLLDFWSKFAEADCPLTVEVLTRHAIRDVVLKGRAISQLNSALGGPCDPDVRSGLERLLV